MVMREWRQILINQLDAYKLLDATVSFRAFINKMESMI